MRGTQYPTVATSGTVSDIFDLQNAGLAATLWAPVITSGLVYLQASPDTTSANFTRMGKSDGSGVWSWSAAAGSGCISLRDVLGGIRYARVETQNPQADVRSFAVITQL